MNPIFPTNAGIEDTEHFLLLCSSFDIQRQELLAGMVELLRPCVQINDLSNRNMEGNISREAVHRPWLGVTKFPKMEQTPHFVL